MSMIENVEKLRRALNKNFKTMSISEAAAKKLNDSRGTEFKASDLEPFEDIPGVDTSEKLCQIVDEMIGNDYSNLSSYNDLRNKELIKTLKKPTVEFPRR